MKIAQAKRIPLEDLLERLGHAPQRRAGGQLWYLSPFRPEKTPSFKVNPVRNLWYDFGDGRHGDAVDLVQELENLPSVGAALRRLESWEGMAPCAADFRNETDFRNEPAIPARPAIELLDIGPARSKALKQYLHRRGVDPGLAAPYVQEARYRVGDRERFALAFANDAGGYELRNPFSQLTLGSKAITTLGGKHDRALVFEGFFDFLSYVVLHGKPQVTTVVLNSVALAPKAIEQLRTLHPAVIEIYRDRDAAGAKLLEQFQEGFCEAEVIDRAELYAGYGDLNEWHGRRAVETSAPRR